MTQTLKQKLDDEYELFHRERGEGAKVKAYFDFGYEFATGIYEGEIADFAVAGSVAQAVGQLVALFDHLPAPVLLHAFKSIEQFMVAAERHVTEVSAVQILGAEVVPLLDQMQSGSADAAIDIAQKIVDDMRAHGAIDEAAAAQRDIDAVREFAASVRARRDG